MADENPKINDPFGEALEVAKAAVEAREQAIKAKEKADHIDELAQQAVQEAITLRHLAANLASTAASVATVALGTTGTSNFRDAYNLRAKIYNKKISLGSFIDVIQFGQSVNPCACSTDDGSLKQWQSNETVLKSQPPRTRHTKILYSDNDDSGSETRLPGSRIKTLVCDYEQELSPAHSWTKTGRDCVSRENLEKFPFPGGVYEHKETLAASFESTGNIKPLWEDRYVQPEASGSQGLASQKQDSWQERKAMKQFQFKLAKAEQDGNDKDDSATEEEVLKTPKCVRKVREQEVELSRRSPEDDQEVLNAMTHSPSQGNNRLLSPVLPNSRSASPLLNATERENYTVTVEKEPILPKPRHKFTPGPGTNTSNASKQSSTSSSQSSASGSPQLHVNPLPSSHNTDGGPAKFENIAENAGGAQITAEESPPRDSKPK